MPNPEGDVDGGAASIDGQNVSPRTKVCFESREARLQHKKNIESLFSQIIDLNLLQEKDSFGTVWPVLQTYGSWRMETTSRGRRMYTHLPDSIPIDVIFKYGNSNRDYFLTEEGVLDFVYTKLKTLRGKMQREKAKLAAVAEKNARSIGRGKAKTKEDEKCEVIDLCSSSDEGKKPKARSEEKSARNDGLQSSSDSDEEDAGPSEISLRKKVSSASKQTILNFSVEKKKRPNSDAHEKSQSKSGKKLKLSSETLQVQKEERARKAERRVFHHYHDDDNTGFTLNPDRPEVLHT